MSRNWTKKSCVWKWKKEHFVTFILSYENMKEAIKEMHVENDKENEKIYFKRLKIIGVCVRAMILIFYSFICLLCSTVKEICMGYLCSWWLFLLTRKQKNGKKKKLMHIFMDAAAKGTDSFNHFILRWFFIPVCFIMIFSVPHWRMRIIRRTCSLIKFHRNVIWLSTMWSLQVILFLFFAIFAILIHS